MGKKLKTCARCKNQAPSEFLICKKCKSEFHDQSDQMMALSLLLIVSVIYFVAKDYVSLALMCLMGIFSWFLIYPSWKLFQKWRNPERSIIKEMGYSLPYSWLGALVFFVSAAGFTVIPSGEFLSDQLNTGFESGERYFSFIELGCYFLAFFYLGFILLFHRGVFFTFDRHYARIVSKEYELLTDVEILAKCDGDQCRCYLKNESFDVDKKTFDRVYDTSGCTYFMDRDHIFYLEHIADPYGDQILPEADISSFTFITREDEQRYFAFAKDDHRVYYLQGRHSKALDGLNTESVRVVKDEYITDGRVIYRGPERVELDLDPETLEVLSCGYVRDLNGIYQINNASKFKLDVVDPETFEPVDHETFKDKSGVYQIEHSKIRRMQSDELISDLGHC
jgi:hypothetical protein